jgi:Spy/CpxP family protein refolding chaperone
MKNLLTKKTLALSLVVMAPLACWTVQQVEAGNSTAPLIDKDFEVAMRKFVTKRFYNRIDATDDQRQKLDALFAGTQEKTRPLREQLRQGLLDVSELSASNDATDEQILAKVKELRAIHEQVSDARIDAMLKARKVLTAEQRQMINKRVSEAITGGCFKPRRLSMLID